MPRIKKKVVEREVDGIDVEETIEEDTMPAKPTLTKRPGDIWIPMTQKACMAYQDVKRLIKFIPYRNEAKTRLITKEVEIDGKKELCVGEGVLKP